LTAPKRRRKDARVRAFFVLLSVGAVVLACGGEDKVEGHGNGVNDVLLACQIRGTWKNATLIRCLDCMVAAPLPACECTAIKDYGEKCKAQADAMQAEPACTEAIAVCVRDCPTKDCACVDRCYAASPACRAKASAKDGCIADLCTPVCQ
jgi:hypothetical protein